MTKQVTNEQPPENVSRGTHRVRRAVLIASGVALVGTAVVEGIKIANQAGTINHLDRESTATINHLDRESTAKTESLAAAQAAAFTEALYDEAHYPKGVPMPVLNGEIRTTVDSSDGTKHTGIYKDPILLATADVDARPDLKGDFLKGAWIGIQGNGPDGHAKITAVRFAPADEQFVPYTHKPTDIIFPDLGVYPTADQAGPGKDGLIGFDLMGNTAVTNGDGSVITPGLSTGMK